MAGKIKQVAASTIREWLYRERLSLGVMHRLDQNIPLLFPTEKYFISSGGEESMSISPNK